ncbi:MAG: hypothetical protein KC587_17495 [Nitrospira sp.]|nr:hypothetical protein [Nitrospira sp.]
MKLSDAGRKVWERPWSKPTVVVNRETAVEGYINNGVPFGWVVAKDCLQGMLADHDAMDTYDHLSECAKNQAIALCNALAEEGL